MTRQRYSITFLAAASLALLGFCGRAEAQITHQISLPSGMTWCDDGMINGLLTQVNNFRAQNGVPALSASTLGMKDAELRATQFATYMQTATPGTPGFNPHQGWDTTAASIGYNVVSENLAYMTIDPGYVVYAAWQDPLHIAAMLATDANVAGVSCVYYNGTAYWTYEPGSCTGSSCGTSSNPPPSGGTPVMDSEEWAFLTLINNYRAQNGAGPLAVSVALENSSLWMANDMATKNYASHTDSLGRSPGARLAAFNYTYTPWGENILGGYTTAQDAFTGWQNACDADASGNCTYAHRQNMLNPAFQVIGIGRAYGPSSTYGWYWVTDFGGVVDATITPPSGPPSGPTISSFAASPSSITAGQSTTLTWSVTGATTVTIDSGIGDVTNLTSKVVSPGATTTYTLTATNAAGSATARATVSVGAAPDSQPPSTPTLTSAVLNGATEVDLAWGASTDNVGVAGYQIIRNGSLLTAVSAATLSYADMGLQAGTTYTYAIRAYDGAGNVSAASNSRSVTTPVVTPPPTTTCGTPGAGAFTGCYYNNITLSGTPALVRTDSQINFDWGMFAPDPAVTVGNFSVRWQGNFAFSAGTYTFKALTSDGMRLYIDGNPVIDRWRDQASTFYTAQQSMAAGTHLITVEYYEHTGWSTAHVTWLNSTPVTQAPTILSFSAAPTSVVQGTSSTLSWSVNGATTITIDNGIGDVTSVTSKQVSPAQTTVYTLTASNSAGTVTAQATVTVTAQGDTQPPSTPTLTSAIAKSSTQVDLTWSASTDNVGVTGYQIVRNGGLLASVAGTTYSDTTAAANTTYTYTVRAYDGAGNLSAASNAIAVTTPAPSPSGGACPAATVGAFTGCYYNNLTMSGNPALVRTDNQINFDWGAGTPAPAITSYDFSARWQGYFTFSQGAHSFTATTSDGMRLYIDGNLVLDRWRDQAATMYTVSQSLSAGTHLITVEYYEHTGWPTAHLTWQ
jgi:uncharacterized protein YkwD/chitodextrinase